MIDLHCHILPSLDDGACDEQTALEMAKLAVADGITDIVATPHTHNELYENEAPAVLEAVAHFQEKLFCAEIPLRVHPGAEVHVHVDMKKRLQSGKVLTVRNQGRYVLLEFPILHLPPHADELLKELIEAGFTPLIAHPERNTVLRRDPKRLAKWIEKGAMAQLTAGTLLGQMGRRTRAFATYLVQNNLVHVLASDAHNTRNRRPLLKAAHQELGRLTDRETVALFQENAANILQGVPCTIREPFLEVSRRKMRWF